MSFLNNNIDYLLVENNGITAFVNTYDDRTAYDLSLLEQPTTPNQTCGFTNSNTGNLSGVDVQLEVSCSTNTYFIGGSVIGLFEENYIVFKNNEGDEETIMSNGPYVFDTPLLDESVYSDTIELLPGDPIQPCSINNNSSQLTGEDVVNVNVNVEYLIGDDLIFTQGFES